MTPTDVIRRLSETVQRASGHSLSLDSLTRLFGALFFASLRTEEQELVRFAIAYVDPVNPDPNPPRLPAPEDRWLVPFASRIPATATNLAKLARAVNPAEAWMAVYSDDQGEPFVWALIDQAIHATRFEQHGPGGARPVGMFTAAVIAPGVLRVDHLRGPIALLNREDLTDGFLNVFMEGPVSTILEGYASAAATSVAQEVGPEVWGRLDNEYGIPARAVVAQDWVETFVRVVTLVQDAGHGGAVVLVPDSVTSDLEITYPLPYDRLASSFVNKWAAKVRDRFNLPAGPGMRSPSIEVALRDDEIEGSVRFVAGMTRIDGALIMNGRLDVLGFGATITTSGDPGRVLRAVTSSPVAADLSPIEPGHFGTRHYSMFRYCAAHPGSLGIVVSDDGDLRVVTRLGTDVVFWETVATRTSEMLGGPAGQ